MDHLASMENLSALEKEFHDILVRQEFDRLHTFHTAAHWQNMSGNERQLLALLFIAEGESQLKKNESQAHASFERALKIAPNDPLILYRQAMAYSILEHDVYYMKAAAAALETTVSLAPEFFEAWCAWGCILVRLGICYNEPNYLYQADEKFVQAQKKSEKAAEQKIADIYWQWGLCWFFLGRLEGEAHDFQKSIEKYRQAADLGLNNVLFWNNYGDSIAELSILIGRKELFFEAIEFYQKAVELSPDYYQGWLNLACSYERIYEHTHDDGYFNLAHEHFSAAEELKIDHIDLWLNWGFLLAEAGRYKSEIELFYLSFEKFAQADKCEPHHPVILCRWAEALILCGGHFERVDLLRSAEEKLIKSLEGFSDNPLSWGVYGKCLNELGRYFSDEQFYFKAIDKYTHGLSLNNRQTVLWHGLGLSYFAIGELNQDVEMIGKAVQYCEKAMECGGQMIPQFWNDWGIALMSFAELSAEPQYLEQAIEKFEKGIGSNRANCDLEWLYNYGCAFDLRGEFTENGDDYEKAVQILTEVLQLDPSYSDARYNLALALAHLGDLSDDVECFHKSLEHFELLVRDDNEDDTVWNDWGLTLLNLAELLHEPLHPENSQKYYQQAEEKLLHATALGSNSAYYNLACLNSLLGHNSVAMYYIERAEMARALPSIDVLMHDDWLEGLRDTSDFRHFIALRTSQYEKEFP